MKHAVPRTIADKAVHGCHIGVKASANLGT
jgi:hypothetical protein